MARVSNETRFDRIELVIPHGMWKDIRDYLFTDLTKEYACYLLCGHHQLADKLRLLGCFLFTPDASHYVRQSVASVQLRQELLRELLSECARLGLSLIDLHSHPFADDSVSFSAVDEADEREKAAWFAEHLPKCFYGSIVLGQRSHAARIRSSTGEVIDRQMIIRTLDVPLEGSTDGKGEFASDREWTARQVLAFGQEGQRRLSGARVGIVGLGGIGSGVAVGLARLGVRDFVLIDHDRAELHNLNRVFGMQRKDAELARLKTNIMRREIRRINPDAAIRTTRINVLEGSWKKLLECDLIVTTTDNHESRFLLNCVSEQYLIPQVSIGSLIEADGSLIKTACGHVRVLLPGPKQPCLLCSQIIDVSEVYYERKPPEMREEAARRGYIANFDEPAPAVVHLNGTLIHIALVEIHNLFCNFKEVEGYLFYDLLAQELFHVDEQDTECVVCSPSGANFGRGDLVSNTDMFSQLEA